MQTELTKGIDHSLHVCSGFDNLGVMHWESDTLNALVPADSAITWERWKPGGGLGVLGRTAFTNLAQKEQHYQP